MKRATGKGFIKNAIYLIAISGIATVSVIGVANAKGLERSESEEKVNPTHCIDNRKKAGTACYTPCCEWSDTGCARRCNYEVCDSN